MRIRLLAALWIFLALFLVGCSTPPSPAVSIWPDVTDFTLPLPSIGEGNVCGQIDTGELVIAACDLPRGSQYGNDPYPNSRLLLLRPDGSLEEFYRSPEELVEAQHVVAEGNWIVWTVADRMYALDRESEKRQEIPAKLGLMNNLSLSDGKAVWREDEEAHSGHLKMWDLERNQLLELENIPEPTSDFHTLAVYHKGKLFTCTSSALILLDLETGQTLRTFNWKEESWPGTADFGPWRLYLSDNRVAWIELGKLASVNKGGTDMCSRLVVVDLQTGEKLILGQGGKEQPEGGNAITAALTDRFVAWRGWPKDNFSRDPIESKIFLYYFSDKTQVFFAGTPGGGQVPVALDEETIAWMTLPPAWFQSPKPGDSLALRIVRPMELLTP
ncbi:MAG: hypothetical protein QMD88_08610 [Coprothermobacterota bacterium]|nr:hypothetical protein [Coprothermobacterota bacterium]